jgi:hypothetical protein
MGSLATSKQSDGLRRATYYLRRDQIRGLKMCAALVERTLSDVMREAVDQYLHACAPDTLPRHWKPAKEARRRRGPARRTPARGAGVLRDGRAETTRSSTLRAADR